MGLYFQLKLLKKVRYINTLITLLPQYIKFVYLVFLYSFSKIS